MHKVIRKGFHQGTAGTDRSFDNIKYELVLERLRIHSYKAMEGRIFIGFISLIITSYIRKIMEYQNLYSSYSLSKLYSELKKLRLIQFKNGKQVLTELTSNYKAIFKAFNMKSPVPPRYNSMRNLGYKYTIHTGTV